ncbi:MAG: hypothetical protein HRT73_14620, partial [Flavobacteriales bacterium]|nr:hypothetical protein [Flavobacteriales bacterium]
METGQVTINHTITSVTLNNSFSNPVVIALPCSNNGADEAAIRIANVTSTSFSIYIEEPEN